MARTGLYKSEVRKARDALRAEGRHPSVDALRVALGNTGSKSTIHRYLKELEAEEGEGFGARVAVSDALQDLVTRLAARLHEEAEAEIAAVRATCDERVREIAGKLATQTQEAASTREQLQRAELALHEERTAHGSTRAVLEQAHTAIAQLEERVSGLLTRASELTAHNASLEDKHRHAREALEHFRTSAKEQREQEQRRHEHQVQSLQVELRQAGELLAGKNHELMRLNRDNVRLIELERGSAKELRGTIETLARQQRELDQLRAAAAQLQTQHALAAAALNETRSERDRVNEALTLERERRERAETQALHALSRLQTMEDLFERALKPDALQTRTLHDPAGRTLARGSTALE